MTKRKPASDNWQYADGVVGKKIKVPVNDKGYRIGEGHHNCTISDAMVMRIRDMAEYEHLSCPEIAERTGIKLRTVESYVQYERRADVPRDYRTIEVKDGEQEEGREA